MPPQLDGWPRRRCAKRRGLDQQHPRRHVELTRAGFGGTQKARVLVGRVEMAGDHTGQRQRARKHVRREMATHRHAVVTGNIEAHCEHVATAARPARADDPADGTRRVAKVLQRVRGCRCRRIEPPQVFRRRDDVEVVGLVERQPLGRMPRLDVAPPTAEAGNRQPFGNVFLVVPIVELLPAIVGHVVPDEHRAHTQQCAAAGERSASARHWRLRWHAG